MVVCIFVVGIWASLSFYSSDAFYLLETFPAHLPINNFIVAKYPLNPTNIGLGTRLDFIIVKSNSLADFLAARDF